MFYFSPITKDNTIYNCIINGVNLSSSNAGSSEIVELLHLTSSLSNRGNSRILLNCDISEVSSSIASGEITGTVQYKLFMKSAPHAETVPYGFDVEVAPLSRSFLEGRGLSNFDEGLKDKNMPSNWRQSDQTNNWTTPGGDFYTTANLTASQYFETGFEDLNIDISNIVGNWLTGGLANYGLVVKFSNAIEASTSDFYVKKFFSRNAHAPERTPRLNVLWSDVLQDDRGNISYGGITGSLFYYRFINGAPLNLSPLYVNILNSSSAVVQTLTASAFSNGIHHISGVNLSPTSSTQIFRDVWFSSTTQYFTGNIVPEYNTGSQFYNYDNVVVNLPNLKVYRPGEKTIIRVFAREKDYRPALQTHASTNPDPIFMKNAYYQIINSETEEVLVDFSTGSLKYSKLSYDENGNYFKFWSSALKPEYLYKIKILSDFNNQMFVFDNSFTFKIERE